MNSLAMSGVVTFPKCSFCHLNSQLLLRDRFGWLVPVFFFLSEQTLNCIYYVSHKCPKLKCLSNQNPLNAHVSPDFHYFCIFFNKETAQKHKVICSESPPGFFMYTWIWILGSKEEEGNESNNYISQQLLSTCSVCMELRVMYSCLQQFYDMAVSHHSDSKNPKAKEGSNRVVWSLGLHLGTGV